MGQITTGIRSALAKPSVYDTCQWIMGGRVGRTDFAEHIVKATPGCRILDIGCGTGEILRFLAPTVRYVGYDVSPGYIATAQRRFGSRASFTCGHLDQADVQALDPFDIVVASALLHHLDDDAVRGLMAVVRLALRRGGRFATIDPVLVDGQSRVARFLIRHDRGLNIRDPEGYTALVRPFVDDLRGVLRHRTWIPYTHWMMEATIRSPRETGGASLISEVTADRTPAL